MKSIVFHGNTVFKNDVLTGMMDTKAQGWLFQDGLFKEASLTTRISRPIEAYYGKKGYIDARVIDVERNIVRDEATKKDMLNLVITIREGTALVFGGFEFQGNRVFSTDILQGLIQSKVGQTINKETLEADYQRVIDMYLRERLYFQRFQPPGNADPETLPRTG